MRSYNSPQDLFDDDERLEQERVEREKVAVGTRRRAEILAKAERTKSLPKVWVKRHGAVVPISKMTHEHLLATLRLLVRQACLKAAARRRPYALGDEPGGDGASWAFELERDARFEEGWKNHVTLYFEAIKAEARRRGLPETSDRELDEYGQALDSALMVELLGEVVKVEEERMRRWP